MWQQMQEMSFWIEVGVVLVVGLVLLLLVSRVLRLASRRSEFAPAALRIIRNLLWVVVVVIVVGLVLQKFGMDFMGFITATLALVAVGFIAVWSMISNITATMLLLFIKPFRIGDWLEIPSEKVSGKVMDLDLFYTSLENPEGDEVKIPNNLLFQKILIRRGGRVTSELHVALQGSDPVVVEEVIGKG